MRKQPKRKPQSLHQCDATRVGYCPRCRVSTTQRIMSMSVCTFDKVCRTAACERCESEIEKTILPKLPPPQETLPFEDEEAKILDNIAINTAKRLPGLPQ
jgi:hypothetical protein